MVRRILAGRKQIIIPSNGVLPRRGYAENVAHAVLLAVDNPEVSKGQIYNIRDERQHSRRQQVEFVARRMGHQWEIVELPPHLVDKVYKAETSIEFDICKVCTQLGYRDIVSSEDALARSVDWLLTHQPVPGSEAIRYSATANRTVSGRNFCLHACLHDLTAHQYLLSI